MAFQPGKVKCPSCNHVFPRPAGDTGGKTVTKGETRVLVCPKCKTPIKVKR